MTTTQMRQQSWLELIARVGYAARGLVFATVGILAALAAIGARHRAPDSKDALRTILNEPFGQAVLALIAAGLVCFAVWRMAQAAWDVDHEGSRPNSMLRRLIWAGAAFFYLGFAWVAVTMIFGADRSGDSDQLAREWTAWLLAQPFGQWLVGAVGAAFVVAGLGVAARALRADFSHGLEAGQEKREIVTALGIAGFLARALVFAMIGLFLLFAAVHSRSGEAKGLGGALGVVQRQPYGSALLGLTAAGLLAFGLYGIGEAFYRRITPPRLPVPR
jgi:Domain of Unknown Function (DUF1206)